MTVNFNNLLSNEFKCNNSDTLNEKNKKCLQRNKNFYSYNLLSKEFKSSKSDTLLSEKTKKHKFQFENG